MDLVPATLNVVHTHSSEPIPVIPANHILPVTKSIIFEY